MKRILAAATLALLVGASPLVSAYAATAELKPYTMDAAVDLRASELIGQRIYATADDVEGRTLSAAEISAYDDIGEINDVVLTPEGQVKAVVLGIGGFLGLGERDVTVEMSSLRFVAETDGADRFIVVNADKTSLTALADEQKAAMAPAVESTGEAVTETAEAAGDAAATTGEAVVEKVEDAGAAAVETTKAAGTVVAEKVEEGATAVEEAATDNTTAAPVATETAADSGTQVTTTAPAATTETAAATERTPLVRPQVEAEGYADVAVTELTADDFTGKRVYGADGEDIGEISDLVMSTDGGIEQAVLDVGGFLGIGERKIAVPMDELQLTRNGDGDLRVYIQATQAELEAQPEYVAQ